MRKKRQTSASAPATDARGKRRAIIDGARRVFQRHGFSGASVVAIAAEAAVSKRTLYQYFPSKEALFAEIIRETNARILVPLPFPRINGKKPRETLREAAFAIARITVLGEGLDLYRMVSAEANRFPKLGRIYLELGYGAGVTRLSSYFALWHASGVLNVSNPRLAADLFFEMVNSVRLPVLLGVAPSISESQLSEWLDFVIDVFLEGVQSRVESRPRTNT